MQYIALNFSENFGFVDYGIIMQNNSIAVLCSPGSYLDNNECILCPKGTYAKGYNNSICTQCPVGKFNSNIGANSKKQCYPCYYGTYSNILGAERCLDCLSTDYCEIGTFIPQKYDTSSFYTNIQPINYSPKDQSKPIFLFQLLFGTLMLGLLIIGIFFFSKIQFKNIDMFTSYHSYKINSPIIHSTTQIGVIFSIIFIVIAIIFALSAVLVYSLQNVGELKILQPLSIIQYEVDNFYADIEITSIFKNYGDVCNVNNSCSSGIKVTPYNFDILGDYKYACQQKNDSCVVIFSCYRCAIGSQSSIQLSLQSTYSYSSSITVIVTSTSSIPDSNSSVSTSINTQINQLFVGSDDSIFYFLMTPSFFISYVSDFQSNVTGYHVSKDINTVYGSIYSIDELSIVFQLGITVYLTQSNSGLYTERYQIQTFILLMIALLGSLAGIMEILRLLMRFIEKHYIKFLEEKKKSKLICIGIKSKRKMLELNFKLEFIENIGTLPTYISKSKVSPTSLYLTEELLVK